jgi:putative flippase GtrA
VDSVRKPFFRFLIAGATNTILSYLIYLLLLTFLTYAWAYSLAYCAGIVTSYFLNARYVFVQPLSLKDFIKFPLVYIVQYSLGIVMLKLLVEAGSVDPKWGMIFVMLITIPVTFLLSKYLLVSRRDEMIEKI